MVSIAAKIERIQRIQSMPAVAATPSWVAAQLPTAAPIAPQTMVQRIEMFWRPRMKKRAITPIIAPVITIVIRASIVVSKGRAPAAVTGGLYIKCRQCRLREA